MENETGESERWSVQSGPDPTPIGAAYPVDTSAALARMFSTYERRARPQAVSFRQLVPWIKVGERATHYIHPYPAKLLPQIAHFFLAARQFCPPTHVVLDPFGGTGTVPLEAMLAGHVAYYADKNPLARLIAATKTSPISSESLRHSLETLRGIYRRRRAPRYRPDVINIDHWYHADTAKWLAVLRECVEACGVPEVTNLLLVTFSAVARKASRADSRLSVPVRDRSLGERALAKDDVWRLFEDQYQANWRRLNHLAQLLPTGHALGASCVGTDARSLSSPGSAANLAPLSAGAVDLVITSPPYGGAQKYIRASSLSLNWIGLAGSKQLARLEQQTIGREHFKRSEIDECPYTGVSAADRLLRRIFMLNRARAMIAGTYLNEMASALAESHRVLKPGGHLVLVIGNNEVCGFPFKSSDYLQDICHGLGFKTRLRLVDEIRSRGLMTKRNRAASVISREWVLVLERGR